jgi:hypothetical protein
MTSERPVLRRRRDADPTPAQPSAQPQPPAAARPAADPTTRPAADPRPARPSAPVGRRAYDPQGDRPSADRAGNDRTSNARNSAERAAGPPRSSGPRKFAPRSSISQERANLRAQAQTLAKDKGIPLIHAYRIIKGQTTLNDVLKAMMRQERFEQMVNRDGIDRELAGQVASGHLSKQRALLLTRMRTLRKQKLHVDGIKAAELEKARVALDFFGRGWVNGRIRSVRQYDFDFLEDNGERPERFFKHDVKGLCAPDDLPAVLASSSKDDCVTHEGLSATDDRKSRVRPDDEILLRAIESQRVVRLTMRDGELFLGRLRSFGRWDAELCLEGGELLTVFFHGLHAASRTLGYAP